MERDYILKIYEMPKVCPSIMQIQIEVCGQHGIRLEELLSDRRCKMLSRVRHLAIWRARNETVASYPEIARAFNRDHTTVLYAVKKVEQRMKAGE